MSQIVLNCQAGSIALGNMFYRDTQALVIHISRGKCARGDIVILIIFALARRIPQRGFNKVI